MKKTFTLLAVLVAVASTATAQDATKPQSPILGGTWTTSSKPALTINEQFYNNWSSSGNSQIAATASFFGNYKYTHSRFVWDNIVDLAYGYAWQDLDNDTIGGRFESRRKNVDKIDITSSLSFKAFKDWGANFTANFKSQFDNGYEYTGFGPSAEDSKTLVSGFMSPAYLTTALSFEHKRDNWSVSLSFLTGKTTFVTNDILIADGRYYGVIQPNNFDPSDPSTFDHAYFALGSYIKLFYLKKDILPKLDLYARAEFFYDYKKPSNMAWSNDPVVMSNDSKYTLSTGTDTWQRLSEMSWVQRRWFETDVDFELKLDYRLSSHIAANFSMNLKHDTDFSGMGAWGHWQIYQMAGVQIFFDFKTPRS
ncbi:MAG: DUF3078 domain-containing protein [Bacteroidales bacterium]|nr:DUF3078 domain-containing protein [Bacteroidales bacterium]